MRHQGWMLMFAGLLAMPQSPLFAAGWDAPADYWRSIDQPQVQGPAQQRFAPFSPPINAAFRPINQAPQRMAAAPDFRFRPWQGSVPYSARPQQGVAGYGAPSYWAGLPADGPSRSAFRPMLAPPPSGQAWLPRGAATPPVGNAYAEQFGPAYGYRFRPLSDAPQAPVDRSVRYRPLQMEIPDRYVFRPLHPVARSAPVAPPRPAFAYQAAQDPRYTGPVAFYPMATYPAWPYNAGMYAPVAPPVPWGGAMTAYPAPQWPPMPSAPGFPPAVGLDNQRLAYQPPPSRESRHTQLRAEYPRRYARRQPVPHQFLPYPVRQPMPASAPWPLTAYRGWEMTAQQPPLPMRLNRYGTDWYDGRGDGEGAWYRLTLGSAPTLTQAAEAPQAASWEQPY